MPPLFAVCARADVSPTRAVPDHRAQRPQAPRPVRRRGARRNLDELAAATGLTLAQVVTHLALLIASDLAEGAIRAPRRIDEATVVTYVRKA